MGSHSNLIRSLFEATTFDMSFYPTPCPWTRYWSTTHQNQSRRRREQRTEDVEAELAFPPKSGKLSKLDCRADEVVEVEEHPVVEEG
jgi:hypothetical protein